MHRVRHRWEDDAAPLYSHASYDPPSGAVRCLSPAGALPGARTLRITPNGQQYAAGPHMVHCVESGGPCELLLYYCRIRQV